MGEEKNVEKIELDGKEVGIERVDLELPAENEPWTFTKRKKLRFKPCTLRLYFDFEGQQEVYSGIKVIERLSGKYSHPSIYKDGQSQVAEMFKKYANFVNKHPDGLTLKDFLIFLDSKNFKCLMETKDVENSEKKENVRKNFIKEFKTIKKE
jgi:hypothetical protein